MLKIIFGLFIAGQTALAQNLNPYTELMPSINNLSSFSVDLEHSKLMLNATKKAYSSDFFGSDLRVISPTIGTNEKFASFKLNPSEEFLLYVVTDKSGRSTIYSYDQISGSQTKFNLNPDYEQKYVFFDDYNIMWLQNYVGTAYAARIGKVDIRTGTLTDITGDQDAYLTTLLNDKTWLDNKQPYYYFLSYSNQTYAYAITKLDYKNGTYTEVLGLTEPSHSLVTYSISPDFKFFHFSKCSTDVATSNVLDLSTATSKELSMEYVQQYCDATGRQSRWLDGSLYYFDTVSPSDWKKYDPSTLKIEDSPGKVRLSTVIGDNQMLSFIKKFDSAANSYTYSRILSAASNKAGKTWDIDLAAGGANSVYKYFFAKQTNRLFVANTPDVNQEGTLFEVSLDTGALVPIAHLPKAALTTADAYYKLFDNLDCYLLPDEDRLLCRSPDTSADQLAGRPFMASIYEISLTPPVKE